MPQTQLTFSSKLRAEQVRASQDYQRQLEHVQKTAEANSDRTRKRMEAEIADLQGTISKLEADLTKV
jgi:intracellular protein transport protein USO1